MNRNLKLPPIKKIHEVAKSPSSHIEFRYFNCDILQQEKIINDYENKKESLISLYNDYKEKRNEYIKIKREGMLNEKEYFSNLVIIEKILRYTKVKDSIDNEVSNLIENTTETEESKKDETDSNLLVKNLKEQNKALSKELQNKAAELNEITVSNKGEKYMNMTQIFLNNESDIEAFKYHYNNLLYKYEQLVNKIILTEQQSHSDKKELNKFKVKCETFMAKNEKIEEHNTEMKKKSTLGRCSSLPEIKTLKYNEIDKLNKTLDDTCLASESKEETISKKNKDIESLNKNIINLKKKCEGLSKQIYDIRNGGLSNDPFSEVFNLKDNIKKKNQKLKDKKNKIQETRKSLANQLNSYNDYLANLEKEKIQLQSLQDLLKDEDFKNQQLEQQSLKNKETICKLEQELLSLQNEL